MDLRHYRQAYQEGDAPGWEAITRRLADVYPGLQPVHVATPLHAALGGTDYLHGVSLYRHETPVGWHHHYVTFGFSSLFYDEMSASDELSGWGFELTFRLKPYRNDDDQPAWPVSLLQNIARYVHRSQRGLDDGHCMPANGPIRLNTPTRIVALGFVTDPILGIIETPHGQVKFLQAVGLTDEELKIISEANVPPHEVLESLRARDYCLVTDLDR